MLGAKTPSENRKGCVSVVFGHQHRRDGAIRFSDYPELGAASGAICREESRAFVDSTVVRLTVMDVQVAPIAGLVSLDTRDDVLLSQLRQGIWRCDNLAKAELC